MIPAIVQQTSSEVNTQIPLQVVSTIQGNLMRKYPIKQHNVLFDDSIDNYLKMFDSMDSDILIVLLRDVHRYQNDKAVKQLIAQLDKMLEQV